MSYKNKNKRNIYIMYIPVWGSSRISEGLTPKKDLFSIFWKARIYWNNAFEVPLIF